MIPEFKGTLLPQNTKKDVKYKRIYCNILSKLLLTFKGNVVCVCVCVHSKPQMNELLFSKWIYNGSISQTKWDVICFRVLKKIVLLTFPYNMCLIVPWTKVIMYLYIYILLHLLRVGELGPTFWATRKPTEFSQSLCAEVFYVCSSDLTSKLKKGQNTCKRGKMCMTPRTNNDHCIPSYNILLGYFSLSLSLSLSGGCMLHHLIDRSYICRPPFST